MNITFELAPSGSLPPSGGPADDDPSNFIHTGELGLRGVFIHDGNVLVAVLEDPEAENSAEVGNARAELEKHYRVRSGGRPARTENESYGYLVLQLHSSAVVRIEYTVAVLRGQVLRSEVLSCRDYQIETALERWVQGNRRSVSTAVHERSDELR